MNTGGTIKLYILLVTEIFLHEIPRIKHTQNTSFPGIKHFRASHWLKIYAPYDMRPQVVHNPNLRIDRRLPVNVACSVSWSHARANIRGIDTRPIAPEFLMTPAIF